MISHMKIVLIISTALLFLAIIGMFVRERKRVGARLVENKDSLNAQLEEFAPRKTWRTRRIASHRNRMTNAMAATGAASASKVTRSAPPSSAVAITEFPRPPVKTVE